LLVAGAFLMFLIVVLSDLVAIIPMAALVGVMFMVSISTFDWGSIKNLAKWPRSDAFVMVATVVIVLFTDNLALGVLAGVLLSAIFFAAKISKIHVTSKLEQNGKQRKYYVKGQLFFASVSDFPDQFDYNESIEEAMIDLSEAHLWDDSAIGALDKIEDKFKQNNIKVQYTGLNKASEQLKNSLSGLT